MSPEAHNPRVVTESNLSDGSKETSVGSMGFEVTTSKAPSGQLCTEFAVESPARSYAGRAPVAPSRSSRSAPAALGAIDDRYCGPVRTAHVG